jgi:hypothetical protein
VDDWDDFDSRIRKLAEFFAVLHLRAIASLITAGRQIVSLQVTSLPVEPAGAWVQRNVIGRFFVVGA